MKKTNTLTAIISLVLIVGAVIGIIGLLGSIGFASSGSGASGSGGSDNTAVSPDTCKHNYTVVSNTATCTEDGVLTKKCSDCLNVVTSEVTAPGHSIVNYLAKDPTCTEEGSPAYSACTKCEYTTFSPIPALGHDLVAHEDKAATCSEEGYTGKKTCSRCDYVEQTITSKLDHKYVDGICSVCGDEQSVYKLSGTWEWGGSPMPFSSSPIYSTYIPVNFVSNDLHFTHIYTHVNFGGGDWETIYYCIGKTTDNSIEAYKWDGTVNDPIWAAEEYKVISFDGEQVVPKELYFVITTYFNKIESSGSN